MASKKNKKNLLCIGAGYVGGPTMAMIAHKCTGCPSPKYFGSM